MKLSVYLLVAAVLFSNHARSQASLVKDIDNAFSTTSALEPNGFTTYKDKIYYSDRDDQQGRELWVTDGTPEGTHLFKDISPGVASSNPGNFKEMKGILYFVASDLVHGTELWRTDGTLTGTSLVKDINPGTGGSFGSGFTIVHDVLYLVAFHHQFGRELWRSDGTAAGTYMVKDINPGIQSSYTDYPVNLNGILLFDAKDEIHGEELWRSDGTEAGTYLVDDMAPGKRGSMPLYLTLFKDRVYFATDTVFGGNAYNGREIWTSDGSEEGTYMFLDNEFDGRYNHYYDLLAGNDYLYFEATPVPYDAHALKLWKTDGTNQYLVDQSTATKGVRLLKIEKGNPMYYYHLQTDPSTRETHIVVLNDASGASIFDESFSYAVSGDFFNSISDIVQLADNTFVWELGYYQHINDPETGQVNVKTSAYLLKSQKDLGSTLVNTFSLPSPTFSTLYNGKVVFSASTDEPPLGASLYITNGTVAGTSILKSEPRANSSNPRHLTAFKDKLLFEAKSNSGLWISDGTESGTLPIEKDFTFTSISDVVATTDAVYFSALTSSSGEELWRTDGTAAGTTLLRDFIPGETSSYPRYLTPIGNELFFAVNNSDTGMSLWKTDGTTTTLIKDLSTISNYSISNLVRSTSGDILYFDFNDGVHGYELWKTNGTAAGTVLVSDIVPGSGSSISPWQGLGKSVMADEILYFAFKVNDNDELWRSDGTVAGTSKLSDFAGELYTYLMNFCPFGNDKILFTNSNQSLWISDGTTQGTVKLRDFPFDIIDDNASGPEIKAFATLGDKGYFFKGIEFWETDGTAEGTKFVTYFEDYSGFSFQYAFIQEPKVFDGHIVFTASSQDESTYLWSTNGTAEGTRKIPGVKNVADLEVMNGVLYFAGEGSEGVELWKYVTLSDVTSIEPESLTEVFVYPNPGSGPYTIVVNGTQPLESIELLDNLGRKVPYKILLQDEKQIQLKIEQDIPGLYLFRLKVGDQLIVRKIIKQ